MQKMWARDNIEWAAMFVVYGGEFIARGSVFALYFSSVYDFVMTVIYTMVFIV